MTSLDLERQDPHGVFEPLWDESAAAKYLGLSVLTLRKARMTGNGPPYIKLGAAVRYVPSAFVNGLTQQSTVQNSKNGLTVSESAPQPSVKSEAKGQGTAKRPRGRPRKQREAAE